MGFLKEFKEFALKGNVVDMAVGVIIGGAFGKIVTSLVPISSDLEYGYGYSRGLLDPSGNGFNIGTQIFGSDTDGGLNIYTQQFGYEAPLGGGWLVLTIAGTAYAFKKRKNNNKK